MKSSATRSTTSKSAPAVDCWDISDRRGHDPRPGAAATIDLDFPGAGIVVGESASAHHLLGLDLEPHWRLADHWARAADLTAVYESNDARRLRATAMWRLHPCGGGGRAWQAVVSAQTALLQSDSILAVTSTFRAAPGDAWLWGTCRDGSVDWQPAVTTDATCVLLRAGGARASVLVAGHPGEVQRIETRPRGGHTAVTCWLFSSALEKGVLLRSRVLAAEGPAHGDEAWATAAAASFAALPPLLTT
jgi:hypothetical protein